MTTDTKNLEWLAKICDPDREKGHLCGEPWTFLVDGDVWSFATDGRALAMVKSGPRFCQVEHRWHKGVKEAVAQAKAVAPGGTVFLRDLKNWCRDCDLYGECEGCAGTGTTARCPTCGTEGVKCPDCDGTGLKYLDPVEGIVGNTRINKALLWNVVRHLGDGEMQIATDSSRLVLQDAETLVAVMCLSGGEPIDDEFEEIIPAQTEKARLT